MVAICVLNTLEDMSIDFPDERGLLIRENVFNSLNGEEAMHQIMENTSPGRSDLPFELHDTRTSEERAEGRARPWCSPERSFESASHTRIISGRRNFRKHPGQAGGCYEGQSR